MDIIAFNLIIQGYSRWVSELKNYKNLKSEIQVEITAVYFDPEVIKNLSIMWNKQFNFVSFQCIALLSKLWFNLYISITVKYCPFFCKLFNTKTDKNQSQNYNQMWRRVNMILLPLNELINVKEG